MLNRLLSLFLLGLTAAMRATRGERGQTGMEIALVGVVCATCVLGTVVIATSDEASQQLESVLHASLSQASGTLVVNGSVVAIAGGEPLGVQEIVITVGVIGKPGPVLLDSSAEGERLVVSFLGDSVYDSDVPYTAAEIVGDHDGLLEAGETAELRLDIAAIGDGSLAIGPNEDWTLELRAPVGGVVDVSRTMPFALQKVNSLH